MKLLLPFYLNRLFTILLLSFFCLSAFAQDTVVQKRQDSLALPSKIIRHADSLNHDTAISIIHANAADSLADSLKHDSLPTIQKKPAGKILQKNNSVHLMQGIMRNVADRDIVFYILLFLLFFLGLIRASFNKYFNSVFSLSFQAAFRQTQTKEQMSQNFFPAFMLNVLFILCGGMFITLFTEFNRYTALPFWQVFVYSTILLLIIYLIKDIVIRFTGWVFNAKDAATEYRFVVFLINKLLAVMIIPLLFFISYADDVVKKICITIVICLLIFSLLIRYLVSFARIRKNLSLTAFHFFIYLCAVEIMPLLIIYKLFISADQQ